jgi:REP element-mobilizing transposase RayT
MQKVFSFEARVWQWPGDMPWIFVSLSPEMSKPIRDAYPKASMIKLQARIGHTTWNTSFFRNKKDSNYILPIKKDIRKKETIYPGDIVEVFVEIK